MSTQLGRRYLGMLLACAWLAPLSPPAFAAAAPKAPGDLDAARLAAADQEPQNWFTGGRDKDGSYYSPLSNIDAKNVKQLGFAWQYDLGNPMRGQEATPIVIDGVMYTSGTWGYVYAVNAASGKELWRYDPKPDYFIGRHPCCDLVNRGVAVWKGKVYVASVDGRLHALDAATGKKIWVADTITDHKLPYSSTGAPQVAGNVVVIGNSGADMGHTAVRGYVAAYDLETGKFKWRFYTVPPAVGQPYENPELAQADKTWDPHRKPEFNGGGTAWDGFAYDAALNLVYFGTANAAPYDLRQLGPAKLDSLFTASILALDASTGRMAWYYQTTPRDSWDYDSVQKLILADLTVDGASRPVIMQASKNGFFYVLDRKTRAAALGQELHLCELGVPRGHENRPAGRDQGGRLVFIAEERVSILVGRPHLESHVLQCANAPGVHPRHRHVRGLGRHAAQRRQDEIPRWVFHRSGHLSR